MVQGRLDEADTELRSAIAIRPELRRSAQQPGHSADAAGSLDPANRTVREVVRIRPDGSDAHYNLGRALLAKGTMAEAIDHLRRAIAGRPDAPSMMDDLAWILATSPDDAIRQPKEAVSLAERAVALTGRKSASILDTLGAGLRIPQASMTKPPPPRAMPSMRRAPRSRSIWNRRFFIVWRSTSRRSRFAKRAA